MKIRILMLSLTLILISGILMAQTPEASKDEVPEAIVKFITGLNEHSYSTASPVISRQFGIPGVPQEYIGRVLSQMFSSFPAKITQYKYKSFRQDAGGMVYVIELTVNDRIRDVEFGMDNKGKVTSCNIFSTRMQGEPRGQISNLKLKMYAEVDFELVNGIILLPVELNGEKQKFILDSGAPVLIINSIADTTGSNSLIIGEGVGGSINNTGTRHIDNLSWAGGSNAEFQAVTMDLSHLEAEVGEHFGGLISKAELEPYEVYFDYAGKKIKLFQLDKIGNFFEPNRFVASQEEVFFTLKGHIAVLDAKVGKKKLKMGLDTGAQTNLLDDKHYPRYQKILQNVQTDTLRGADTNSRPVTSGTIATTQAGTIIFPDMIYVFSDIDPLNVAYRMRIDGLLGSPFMAQRPFSINYRKKVLRFY
jgi:hypothetical protein